MTITESDSETSPKTERVPEAKLAKSKTSKAKTTESKPSNSKDSSSSTVISDNEVDDKQKKIKNKTPIVSKSAKSKVPIEDTTSDNEHEEVEPATLSSKSTKLRPNRTKNLRTKMPPTPTNTPENEPENGPITSGSKTSSSKIMKVKTVSKNTVIKEASEDEEKDEKLQRKSTSVMVMTALNSLHNRKGTSTTAIKKYIDENYDVEMKNYTKIINNFLKKSVESGEILQITGKGASGSFKLPNHKKKQTVSKETNIKEYKLEKPLTSIKKQKMAIVSTPKRKSFTIVSSKRKSLGAPKGVKSRKPMKGNEEKIIEKKPKAVAKKAKAMKLPEETQESNEKKSKKGTKAKKI